MFAVKSAQMKMMDNYMIETVGLPGMVLMENASKSVVDYITSKFSVNDLGFKSIVVLCGTGNNGGDGLAIARWLIQKGYRVVVLVAGSEEKFKGDAANQLKMMEFIEKREDVVSVEYMEEVSHVSKLELVLRDAGVVVDALIGTGCSRTLSELYINVVDKVNRSNAYTVSVDVPTGINSDNGKVMGGAVRADATITFCLPKLGLVLYPGNEYVGQLVVTDIGIIEEALSCIESPVELLDQDFVRGFVAGGGARRTEFSHKGTFGTVGIIAGDRHMLGATILSAKAAYRTGAGLVKVFALDELSSAIIQAVPECVVVPYDKEMAKDDFDRYLENFVMTVGALVIGPGLSKSLKARHMVKKILAMDVKAVMDADALNIISEHMEWFEERVCQLIITPHIGEMARLTGYPSSGISENTLQFALAFMEKYGVNIVLKSARTVITTTEPGSYINMYGNSGMATAGSGDVLTGVIGALVADGRSLAESSKVGVVLHSMAGDSACAKRGKHQVMASDIIDHIWSDFYDY